MKKIGWGILFLSLSGTPARAQTPERPVFAALGGASFAADSVTLIGRQFIAVSVSNLVASQRWYERTFGLVPLKTIASADTTVSTVVIASPALVVELSAHRTAKSLRDYAGAPTPGFLVHGFFKAGLFVSSLDTAVAVVRRRGATGVTQPMGDTATAVRWVFLRDPDGNFVQLLESSRAPVRE